MFAVRDLYRSSKLRADWRLVKDADEATAIGALALVEDDGSVRPLPTGNASPK